MDDVKKIKIIRPMVAGQYKNEIPTVQSLRDYNIPLFPDNTNTDTNNNNG